MSVVFSFPGFEGIADAVAAKMDMMRGDVVIRYFPDDESYVKLESDVQGEDVIIVCGLDHADQKIMALMFFANVASEMGARSIGLIAPYLGYMRQDKRFFKGEAVTSNIFAAFLSCIVDWLITIDPHLHRHKSLDEIYSIPSRVIGSSDLIATWIKNNVHNALLIGPDGESEQWVGDVADKASTPFIILKKIRYGDQDVEVSVPNVDDYQDYTPVLVDDIISTARTMIETVGHLHRAGMKPPVCIGVHGIFAGDAYENLLASGVERVVTCNSIAHVTNGIEIEDMVVGAVRAMLAHYGDNVG